MTGWWMSVRRGTVLLAALGAACGGADKPPPVSKGITVGEQSKGLLAVLCQRAVGDCKVPNYYGPDVASCESDGYNNLCLQIDCDQEALSYQGNVDRCTAALAAVDCAVLATGELPAQCIGVIRYIP